MPLGRPCDDVERAVEEAPLRLQLLLRRQHAHELHLAAALEHRDRDRPISLLFGFFRGRGRGRECQRQSEHGDQVTTFQRSPWRSIITESRARRWNLTRELRAIAY